MRRLPTFIIALNTLILISCTETTATRAPQPSPQATHRQAIDCAPPSIVAPEALTLECTGERTSGFVAPEITSSCDPLPNTDVFVDGEPAYDPYDYPFGYSVTEIVVTDFNNQTTTRSVPVRVQDTRPPTLDVGEDQTVECTSPRGAMILPNAVRAEDACDDAPWVWDDLPEDRQYPLGTHQVTVTAVDASGNVSRGAYSVRVRDKNPPHVRNRQPLRVAQAARCDAPDDRCCDAGGGIDSGTLVALPLPRATDVCTRSDALTYLHDVGADASAREVCLPNDATTTVTWTVYDAAGNLGRGTHDVIVTPNPGDLALEVQSATQGWVNSAASVRVRAGDAAVPVQWSLVGDAAPNGDPGDAIATSVTFSAEGVYCPLYVAATDNNGDLGFNDSICFGIERDAPVGVFDQLPSEWFSPSDPTQLVPQDDADPSTWPVFFAGERIPVEIDVEDHAGGLRSGLANVQLTLDPEGPTPRDIVQRSYPGQGRLQSGPTRASISGCDTDDAACAEGGGILIDPLVPGEHVLALTATDQAGNTATLRRRFRVQTYRSALGDIIAWLEALTADNPLASDDLHEAIGHLETSLTLYTSNPGYAFAVAQRAERALDDLEGQALTHPAVSRAARDLLARAVRAEVHRLVSATEDANLADWPLLRVDGAAYLDRPLLTGREASYSVEVEPTLAYARALLNGARVDQRAGLWSEAIGASLDAFNALQPLFQDAVYAPIVGRAPYIVEAFDEGLAPEAYFRTSTPQRYGVEIARTIFQQANRTLAIHDLPNTARRTFASLLAKLTAFDEVVTSLNEGVISYDAEFIRTVYLNTQGAIDDLRALSHDRVYTHHWQTGLAYVMLFVINDMLYETPPSITGFIFPNTFNIRGESLFAPDDDQLKAVECRYDRAVQAVVDGRIAEGLDLFKASECVIINLYNRYYGYNTFGISLPEPIDPADYGCPTDADEQIPVDVAAECPCLGAAGLNDATCDGIDDDCDGIADEDYQPASCGEGACGGVSQCLNGRETACLERAPRSERDVTCDGVDDNCDGRVDEGYLGYACDVCACAAVSTCQSGVERGCSP